jgi:hypothetical protein
MGRAGMTCLLGQAWRRLEAQSCLKGKKVPCTTAKKKKNGFISTMKISSEGCRNRALINACLTKARTAQRLRRLNVIHFQQVY